MHPKAGSRHDPQRSLTWAREDESARRRYDRSSNADQSRWRWITAGARSGPRAGKHPRSLHGRPPGRSALPIGTGLRSSSGAAAQLEACLAGIEFIHQATDPATDAPATLGEFRIIRELGRGGMGVVYEAEQTSLRRHVALKVLRFGAVADEDAMKRFRREAETVARLHHTNIVPIFAVGCERGVHYYAMQFIAGRSLADVLAESQRTASTRAGGGRRSLGPSGGRGPGACASARCDPPRHQAVEPAARRMTASSG